MDISFSRLRQLVAVARVRNLSRAAAELNLSQPALSRSIALLEQHYGIRIFDRHRTGVTVTSAGMRIVEEAENMLRYARTLDQNLKLLSQSKIGRLSIGLGPLLASVILPHLSEKLFFERPQIELETMIRPEAPLLQALLSGQIELCICADDQASGTPHIETRTLGEIAAACVVRNAHPLAGKRTLTRADIENYPLASPVDPYWVRGPGFSGGVFTCDNYHIIRDALHSTDLIGICPRQFVSEDIENGRLALLEVEDLLLKTQPIVVAYLDGRTISPLGQEAIRICENYLSGLRLAG